MIGIDGKLYAASQLAFLYMRGFLPEPEADHRNGNNSDDRWDNLREATRSQQLINRVTRNKTGQRGVYHHAFSGLYRAAIKVDGRVKSLGYFRSAEEAGAAYRAASMAQHGEFSVFRRQ